MAIQIMLGGSRKHATRWAQAESLEDGCHNPKIGPDGDILLRGMSNTQGCRGLSRCRTQTSACSVADAHGHTFDRWPILRETTRAGNAEVRRGNSSCDGFLYVLKTGRCLFDDSRVPRDPHVVWVADLGARKSKNCFKLPARVSLDTCPKGKSLRNL